MDSNLLLFRYEYIFAGSSPTLCKMDGYTFFGPLLYNLSYSRWYLEALFEKEAIRYPHVLAPYVHRLSTMNGYTLNNYSTCVVVLFAMGFAYRALALAMFAISGNALSVSSLTSSFSSSLLTGFLVYILLSPLLLTFISFSFSSLISLSVPVCQYPCPISNSWVGTGT